jgi:archaellum component FlaC
MGFQASSRRVSSKVDSVGVQTSTVDSRVVVMDTAVDSVGTQVTTVETATSTTDSRVVVVDSKVDSVGDQSSTIDSKVDSVGSQIPADIASSSAVSTVDSKVTVVDDEVSAIDSKVDSVGDQIPGDIASSSAVSTVDSKVTIVDDEVSTVDSKVDSVGTQSSTIDSKVDSVGAQIPSDTASSAAVSTVDSRVVVVDTKVDSVGGQATTIDGKVDNISTAIDALDNNVSAKILFPSDVVRDEVSTLTIRAWLYIYGADGAMEDPDSNEAYIQVVEPDGSDLIARTLMTRDGVGRYYTDVDLITTADLGNYRIVCDYDEETNTIYQARYFTVYDDNPDLNSRVDSVGTQTGSVGTLVGDVETDVSTVDSKVTVIDDELSVVDSKVDSVGALIPTDVASSAAVSTVDSKVTVIDDEVSTVDSKVDSVGDQVSTVDSKVTVIDNEVSTVDSKVDSVGTVVGDVETDVSTVDSKIDVVDGEVSTVDSKVDSVGDQVSTVDSKVDDMSAASGVQKGEFTEYVWNNNETVNVSLADGGIDYEKAGTNTTQSTSYAILDSVTIDAPATGTKTVEACYLDIGWAASMDANDGDTKLMVVAGDTPTLTGAVDIPGTERAETTAEKSEYRSGNFLHSTAMDELPFTIMLVGKVDNGADTLTVNGLLGSTISVTYSI